MDHLHFCYIKLNKATLVKTGFELILLLYVICIELYIENYRYEVFWLHVCLLYLTNLFFFFFSLNFA